MRNLKCRTIPTSDVSKCRGTSLEKDAECKKHFSAQLQCNSIGIKFNLIAFGLLCGRERETGRIALGTTGRGGISKCSQTGKNIQIERALRAEDRPIFESLGPSERKRRKTRTTGNLEKIDQDM